MRYYDVSITNPKTGATVKQYTSFVNGKTDPGALDMLIDAQVSAAHLPAGTDTGALVRLWGISLQDISQATNLNGMNIKVSGGMQKGLPLANPSQAGLLVQGNIFQAFGNWQGTNMTLDLQIMPNLGTMDQPANIVLNWPKGQPLDTAVKNALTDAFPNYTVETDFNSILFPEGQWGTYQNLRQFATWLNQFSKPIVGGNYSGVQIATKGATISAYDNRSKQQTTTIAFTDLIGQVTWIGPNAISVTCVMRSAPNVGDYIKLPPGQVTINQASLSQFRQGSVFQGTFQVTGVHHSGHFRQPLSEDWVTIFTAIPVLASGQPATTSPTNPATGGM